MNTINTSIDSDYMRLGATGSLGTIPATHSPAGRRHPCLLQRKTPCLGRGFLLIIIFNN
jgi:hypothetical protein